MKIIIVGAGLFGSIAARLCASQGHDVLVFDSTEANSASLAAACLMRPSWLTSLGVHAKIGMGILENLFEVKVLQFQTGPITVPVCWVNPDHVLVQRNFHDKDTYPGSIMCLPHKVIQVLDDAVFVLGLDGPETVKADAVLVAAGVWTGDLVKLPSPVRGLTGAAHFFVGQVDKPFINPYAPYKQVVGFNRWPTKIWVGDGMSIKQENWTKDRRSQSHDRCSTHLAKAEGTALARHGQTYVGIRPYMDSKMGFMGQVGPKVWAATGGAKNGTVLAAVHAGMFLNELRQLVH